jgi:hypothetical protein
MGNITDANMCHYDANIVQYDAKFVPNDAIVVQDDARFVPNETADYADFRTSICHRAHRGSEKK